MAKIEITTFQNNESYKMYNEGYVFFENDAAFIEYGDEKTDKTCIGISPGLVSLNRIGSDNYTLILEEGKPGIISVEGIPDIIVTGSKLKSKITENGIYLFLSYGLKLSVSEVLTKVRVKATYL